MRPDSNIEKGEKGSSMSGGNKETSVEQSPRPDSGMKVSRLENIGVTFGIVCIYCFFLGMIAYRIGESYKIKFISDVIAPIIWMPILLVIIIFTAGFIYETIIRPVVLLVFYLLRGDENNIKYLKDQAVAIICWVLAALGLVCLLVLAVNHGDFT